MLSRLFAHASIYTTGSLLITIAGVISFPIFTRIFTVAEYGLLNLVSTVLLIVVGFAKLGVQHAIVRFYGEVLGAQRTMTAVQFGSTVLIGLSCTGFVVAVLWAVTSQLVPAHWWNDSRASDLMLMTSVLVFLRATDSAMVNMLRAEQRSLAFNAYAVAKRYGTLAVVLLFVLYVMPGLLGFYAATILAEALAACALFIYLGHTCRFSVHAFSPGLYRAMLAFGIPMIAYEVGGIILNLGDRFVIQSLLGGEALGLYSAAYNLCEYVYLILIASVGQAIVPMYVRLWEERGEEATRRFVEEALHYYVMVGAAVVAGLTAVAPELLVLLASDKYGGGARIIPFVIAGMVISGSMTILGAGLNIFKQTRVLVVLVSLTAVLNLGLNALLVPRFGIMGSAVSSMTSCIVLAALTYGLSNRRFAIALPMAAIAKFALLAFTMYFAVESVHLLNPWGQIVAQMVVGALTYALLVLACDGKSRVAARKVIARLIAGSKGGTS